MRASVDRSALQRLLDETQSQTEELRSQSEELRVSNEQLEQHARALRESQARLELQQVEMEQTNAKLEEQAQMLLSQRDDLNRANDDLEKQTRDLARVSQYKSDFLSNMSHELRTPLNSSLILAKLLADNREGNLTEEQVKYAQAIQSAGNDLLALIADILDLSKVEAGHMDLHVAPVRIRDLISSLTTTFEPMAVAKELEFTIAIDPRAPETIDSDEQRLGQILRNLLSNAFKFTEHGSVALDVRSLEGKKVGFAIRDTGIGIAPEQRETVFEAFRQADGTTNRRFGGTGLGLSISRDLAHLLGGDVTLESKPGGGSTFTLWVPEVWTAGEPPPPREEPPPPQSRRPIPKAEVEDDRDRMTPGSRSILVVEDDPSFGRILYDLAAEHGFQCLIATTAEAALDLANEFVPSAVLLDVGLPDQSGLTVLDRLKHDPRTRHIPVHVISGVDYSQTAISMGAVGYLLKPVSRDDLVHSFEMLEAKLSQTVREVLLVEDDPTQLESLRLLLDSRQVRTVGVRSAAECLELLKERTFDCLVLDLGLQDGSGFSILETLSKEEGYAFPPVIVYTGRDLTQDEEQQLRRYSSSIIVKGAKSPERLLDEVTLFLHQVVADLPAEKQRLIEQAKHRDAVLEDRQILVVEDDIRNVFALTSILEPRGAKVEIARNGQEAVQLLDKSSKGNGRPIDLVLMDIMMPEMDGFAATREIRKRPEFSKLPIIALTAKAMKDDQERCLEAGANDYIAKPLDIDKLLSLIRVWMPRS